MPCWDIPSVDSNQGLIQLWSPLSQPPRHSAALFRVTRHATSWWRHESVDDVTCQVTRYEVDATACSWGGRACWWDLGFVFRYRCKKKAHTRTGQKWADEDGKKSIEADFDKVYFQKLKSQTLLRRSLQPFVNGQYFQYQILDITMIFKAAVLGHETCHCLFTDDLIYLITCCKALIQPQSNSPCYHPPLPLDILLLTYCFKILLLMSFPE